MERVREFAWRYLDRRDRTVTEMRRHLARRGCQPAEVERAIAELLELGYLDDRRYAHRFADDKRELKQWGSDRIRRALLERGVDRELVEAALADRSPDGELEQAVSLLRRRFAVAPADRRERDRALGLLLRKGYDAELALDALRAFGHG